MRLISAVLLSLLLAATGFAADLPEIKHRGQLIAATSGNLPPVTYLNEKNELIGYDIEVGRFIAKHIGVKLDLVRLDWKGILPGLQTGRFDLVFSNVNVTMGPTEMRRRCLSSMICDRNASRSRS